MPSIALTDWRNNRQARLNEVEGHCIALESQTPPNPAFLEESLRGYVLHLSAHFQVFCRELYTECTQAMVTAMPVTFQTAAQKQFRTHLALEKGNPSYSNIKQDFNRFGFHLDLSITHPQCLTDLGHLMDWRNKAAHQGTHPLRGGVPFALSVAILQSWKKSCDGLAEALDDNMTDRMSLIIGSQPW